MLFSFIYNPLHNTTPINWAFSHCHTIIIYQNKSKNVFFSISARHPQIGPFGPQTLKSLRFLDGIALVIFHFMICFQWAPNYSLTIIIYQDRSKNVFFRIPGRYPQIGLFGPQILKMLKILCRITFVIFYFMMRFQWALNHDQGIT